METILAGFAQFDNDIRATRTVQGMRRKIKDGILPWGPPMGYMSAQARGEKKTVEDKPDPTTFTLLQKAWREYATGAYTRAEIGRRMTVWGLPTVHGQAFAPRRSIRSSQILTTQESSLIRGTAQNTKAGTSRWSPAPSLRRCSRCPWPEQLGPASEAQSRFSTARLSTVRHLPPLLDGLFSQGRTRRYAYYHCRNKSCDHRGRSYAAPALHDDFAAFLDRIAPKPELVRVLGEKIVRDVEADRGVRESRRKRQRERVGGLDSELHELVRCAPSGLSQIRSSPPSDRSSRASGTRWRRETIPMR